MEKLSKQEKIKRLNYILNKLSNQPYRGFMCVVYMDFGIIELLDDIPELLKYKKEQIEGLKEAWFHNDDNGNKKRIEILQKTILDIQNLV